MHCLPRERERKGERGREGGREGGRGRGGREGEREREIRAKSHKVPSPFVLPPANIYIANDPENVKYVQNPHIWLLNMRTECNITHSLAVMVAKHVKENPQWSSKNSWPVKIPSV